MNACTECGRALALWQPATPTRDDAEIERLRQIMFAPDRPVPPCIRCGRKLDAGQSPQPPQPPKGRAARGAREASCKGCGTVFAPPSARGRLPAYCSSACRLSASTRR